MRTRDLGRRVSQGERCDFAPPAEVPTRAQVQELLDGSAALRALEATPQILVSSPKGSRSGSGFVCRVWSAPVPKGACVRVKKGMYCVGPEFLPVLMAPDLTLLELIVLLSELMGLYAVCPGVKGGMIQRDVPLTTPELVSAFLDELGPVKGSAQVRRALKFACVRSGSPMETRLSLRLGLKPSMGGYGLKVLSMNDPMEVERLGKLLKAKGVRKPDVLIKAVSADARPGEFSGVAFEYDGGDHLTPERAAEDTRRENELKAMGLKEYHITKDLYRNLRYMDDVVAQARRDAGYPRRHISSREAAEEKKRRAELCKALWRINGITWAEKRRACAGRAEG